jgi:predicted metalloprotease with PDZ domain
MRPLVSLFYSRGLLRKLRGVMEEEITTEDLIAYMQSEEGQEAVRTIQRYVKTGDWNIIREFLMARGVELPHG